MTISKATIKGGTSRRCDAAGARRLAGHLALLAMSGAIVVAMRGGWAMGPAMLAHGIVLVSLFAGLHETIHRTAFRRRWINDAVAAAIGFVHFLPAGHFRRFHGAHHRFVQDPARDPERAFSAPATRAGYLLAVSGLPYWRGRAVELAGHAVGRAALSFVPPSARPAVIREARWHVAGWAGLAGLSIAFGWIWPLWLWLIPALLGQPFLRLYLMAEHGGCADTRDVRFNTRSVRTNALVRFLMWNMPFHIEHHAFPAVPFHALPALHRRNVGKAAVHAKGYTAFHRGLWRGFAAPSPLG